METVTSFVHITETNILVDILHRCHKLITCVLSRVPVVILAASPRTPYDNTGTSTLTYPVVKYLLSLVISPDVACPVITAVH